MSLKRTTAPSKEPATLDEFKSHIHYVGTDQDEYLRQLIAIARQVCEDDTKISCLTQVWQLALDAFPSSTAVICLRMGPVQSITSITYTDQNGDAQTLDAAQYQLDDSGNYARLAPARSCTWPSTDSETLSAVKILYVTGWSQAADVPKQYHHAVKMLAAHFFEHPEAVTLEGTPNRIPFGVRMMLNQVDHTTV